MSNLIRTAAVWKGENVMGNAHVAAFDIPENRSRPQSKGTKLLSHYDAAWLSHMAVPFVLSKALGQINTSRPKGNLRHRTSPTEQPPTEIQNRLVHELVRLKTSILHYRCLGISLWNVAITEGSRT